MIGLIIGDTRSVDYGSYETEMRNLTLSAALTTTLRFVACVHKERGKDGPKRDSHIPHNVNP